MENKLEQNLQLLDFEINVSSPNLLFIDYNYKSTNVPFGELLMLEEAKRLGATAVYFRRNEENQTTLPQIFIYDNTHNTLNNSELVEIHRKIWSNGIVPIYYVIDNTQVRIFDARKPVDIKNKQVFVTPLDTVQMVAEAQEQYQKYSAKLFQNGTFWEQQKNRDKFLHNNSSSQKLIIGLRRFRDNFVKKSNISQALAHKIIVQSILVKYLEERRDEMGNGVFEDDFFSQFNGASNFCEVIRNGSIVLLFETLSTHFNGKIFKLNASEKNTLRQVDISSLANFLDADIEDQQYVLWRLYAFDYLPVELISRIYEEFIPQRDDAVYTPLHLAQFMIDECMPLALPQENYKLIDVSCGSGIFLVTAFKRMVQWWQKQRFDQTGEITPPTIELLQSILRKSIYGVDIEKDAIRLSVFSLSIALCDMLSPTEIWLNLKFDNLGEKNLYTGNFFGYLNKENEKDFDLVIGNPPFKDKTKDLKRFIEDYNLKVSCEIPRDQIALLFLQQAMFLLRKNGLLCLVMPAGPLLYNDTIEYRRDFFSSYKIPQIIDLSALKAKSYLFEREVSTAVIFANNQPPRENHKILHLTVKRSKSTKERHFFEIDRYDSHFVPLEVAVSDPIIWKTNLWGGGQLYYLVKRLMGCRSLEDYLKDKKKNNGWFFAEGYSVGKKNRPYKAPHLTNKPLVETNKFTEDGILEISTEDQEKFVRPRQENKLIFAAPHLLIKETPGNNKFVTAYVEDYLIFKHEIIGIYAPWGQENELRYIEMFLQKNYLLFKVLLLSFSSRAGVSRSLSTVLKKDFMALPFPEEQDALDLSLNEETILLDTLNYGIEEYNSGEKAVVNITHVNEQQLIDFGEVFCRSLNSIYKSDTKVFYPLQPYYDLSYICFPFAYGQKDDTLVLSKAININLNALLENKQAAVAYKRVLRLYQKDIVYLIKPKTLRYWLKSIALRDATDVMQDLVESGY